MAAGGDFTADVLIYFNSLQNGFIYYDDPESVVNNPYIRQISFENLVKYLAIVHYCTVASLHLLAPKLRLIQLRVQPIQRD